MGELMEARNAIVHGTLASSHVLPHNFTALVGMDTEVNDSLREMLLGAGPPKLLPVRVCMCAVQSLSCDVSHILIQLLLLLLLPLLLPTMACDCCWSCVFG
jgi:hypothetical protein